MTDLFPGSPALVDDVTDWVYGKKDLHGGEAEQVRQAMCQDPRLRRVHERREYQSSYQQQDQVVLLEGQGVLLDIC